MGILLVLILLQEARNHVEDITAPTWEYRITQGGTMDGVNCRSPIGGGFGIWTQTWESNRSVRLENVGDTDVVSPWLSNGRNDFRTMKEIVAGAPRPGMSDRERAIAIWRRQTTHRFHASAGDAAEMHDPVKVFNVYGYTTCGDDSICLAGLWHAAGFPVSPGRHLGHRTSQVFYDGRWHLMDGDMGPVYLLRDNATIASEQDLARDHDLVKRSHPHGILDPDRRAMNEGHAALFRFEHAVTADRAIAGIVRESTMSMVLRPGEAIVWRWGRGQKYHGPADIHVWGDAAAARICNGSWEYRPDVNAATVWRMKSPYVFVGGRLEAVGAGAKFFLSWDGSTWQPAGENLDEFFPRRGPARYEYLLKVELPAGARLERLAILNDVQMAPLALPGMAVGENRFVYSDRSPGARKVRITHDWVERSDSRPPAAPVDGRWTGGGFEWRPAETAVEYHVELSDRADLAWPLSSNFEKLVAEAAYRLPSAGLLNPGFEYFWRVRAKNSLGLWGPWSRTWSFKPDGPEVPRDVRLDRGVLRWKGGAARYRVYGSDEKGFSASDEPVDIVVGRSKEISPRRPANFIRETSSAEMAVSGRAFYRVVAVDERGVRSGPSDYAAAPRPSFIGEPGGSATVDAAYRSQVSVVRSLGDLQVQWVDGEEVPSFWDIERPRFALQQGPSWLRIDERTGALSGVPDVAGAVEVAVTVTLERSVRRLHDGGPRPWNLGLGKEKTLGIGTECVGTATQRFIINVRK